MEKEIVGTMEMIHREVKNGIQHNSNNSNGTNNQAMRKDKRDHHRQELIGEMRTGNGNKIKTHKKKGTGTHRVEARRKEGWQGVQERTH